MSLTCRCAVAHLQERTASEVEYICRAGFLRCWSTGAELIAGLPERPGSQRRHFLQASKIISLCSVLIHTAH